MTGWSKSSSCSSCRIKATTFPFSARVLPWWDDEIVLRTATHSSVPGWLLGPPVAFTCRCPCTSPFRPEASQVLRLSETDLGSRRWPGSAWLQCRHHCERVSESNASPRAERGQSLVAFRRHHRIIRRKNSADGGQGAATCPEPPLDGVPACLTDSWSGHLVPSNRDGILVVR